MIDEVTMGFHICGYCNGEPCRCDDTKGELVAVLEEMLLEIEHWHSDMLTEEERHHPRGNGWARVYDKGRAVIAKAKASTR